MTAPAADTARRIPIREVLVVEGRYDKNKLSAIFDTLILETRGFGLFHDPARRELLRNLARTRGLVILTDPDHAGMLIRNHIRSLIPGEYLRHAFVPPVPGKERRKPHAGAQGLLGVEGLPRDTLVEAVLRCGAHVLPEGNPAGDVSLREASDSPAASQSVSTQAQPSITKMDLYRLGLSGGTGSAALRRRLEQRLQLPENLSAATLAQVLDTLMTPEELREVLSQLPLNQTAKGDAT